MSLRDELQAIDGVGEATADKILAVIDNHDTDSVGQDELTSLLALLERGSARVAKSRLEQLCSGEK